MKLYNFYTLGEKDAYGQPALTEAPVGQIKMAIYLTSQNTQDNINYTDANYMALTQAEVNDTYVIENKEERLKVLYVNPKGRFKQVYLAKM